MPSRVTDAFATLTEQLSSNWRVIALVFAAGTFAFSTTGTVKSVAAVPSKLDTHMTQEEAQNNKILKEIKLGNCLKIAELQKTDWTKCVVADVD